MKRLWYLLTLYDKVLIVFLVLLSVMIIFSPVGFLMADNSSSDSQVIVIQEPGGDQQRIAVSGTYREEPLYISVEGPIGTSIIEAHNGKVRMKEAPEDDPEKICEKTGWIEQVGPMIICVPNQISVWIEQDNSEFDGVTW